MTVEVRYLDSLVSGSITNSANALGATSGTWAGDLNVNVSSITAWSVANYSSTETTLGSSITVTARCRKGSNNGTPTVALNLYDAGTLVGAGSTTSVTSTTGQDVTGTFPFTGGVNLDNLQVEVVITGVGGSPSNRNSAQIDYISVSADVLLPPDPPDAPTNLTATADSDSINLTWSAPVTGPNPEIYEITRTSLESVPTFVKSTQSSASTTGLSVTLAATCTPGNLVIATLHLLGIQNGLEISDPTGQVWTEIDSIITSSGGNYTYTAMLAGIATGSSVNPTIGSFEGGLTPVSGMRIVEFSNAGMPIEFSESTVGFTPDVRFSSPITPATDDNLVYSAITLNRVGSVFESIGPGLITADPIASPQSGQTVYQIQTTATGLSDFATADINTTAWSMVAAYFPPSGENKFVVNFPTTTFDDISAEPGVEYTYFVRSFANTLFSAPSNESSATIAAGPATLVVASSSHPHTTDQTTLLQQSNLVVDSTSHSHTTDNVTILDNGVTLLPNNTTHTQTSDTVTITQTSQLAPIGSSHPHTTDSVTVGYNLVPQNKSHGHLTDSVEILQTQSVTVSSASHQHTTDSVVLDQTSTVTPSSTSHVHTTDAITVSPVSLVVPNNTSHSHTTDSVVVSQAHSIAVNSTTHIHTTESVQPSQITQISVSEATHPHSTESVTVSQTTPIVPHDSTHAVISDNVSLIQITEIVVNNSSHNHTTNNVSLVQMGGFFYIDGERYEAVINGVVYRAWIWNGSAYVLSGV